MSPMGAYNGNGSSVNLKNGGSVAHFESLPSNGFNMQSVSQIRKRKDRFGNLIS